MAGSPDWKVYRGNAYVASCKHPEDAAALVALSGGEVRYQHRFVVWREGQEPFPASESYDGAADIMLARTHEHFARARERALQKHL